MKVAQKTRILHLDMDAFFAAVEQRDHPEYRGRPVVIGALPGHRGVVATASYEARRFGIHSAMPIHQAYQRCPDAVYLRPDGRRYAEASQAVMTILHDYSPLVEQVSIDEAYVDISGSDRLFGPAEKMASEIKNRIVSELHLPLSIGVGPNRLIAKLASEHDKPDGLCIVDDDEVLDFLAPLPISNLRGVGPKLQSKLRQSHIQTVRDLRQWSSKQLEQRFGENTGQMLYLQARGQGSSTLHPDEERKQISKEKTFQEDTADPDVLRRALFSLAAEVGRKARSKNLRGHVVHLKFRFPGFETHSRQQHLSQGINTDDRIANEAWALYQNSGFAGRPLRLIGLGISEWQGPDNKQLGLFAEKPEQSKAPIYAAMDQVNSRFGSQVIGFANILKNNKKSQ